MEYRLNTLCNITLSKGDNRYTLLTARYIVGNDGMYLYYSIEPNGLCNYWKRRVLISSISNVLYTNNQ